MEGDETGIVAQISGGHAFSEKLSAMGIRPGVKIKKICTMRAGGPVVMLCGRTQVAIGRRMAEKIFISDDHDKPGSQ